MSRVAAEKAAGLQLAAPLAPLAPLAPFTAGRRRLAQLRRRPPVRPWQLSIDRADADAPVPPPSRSGLRRLATAAVRRAPVGEVGVVGVAAGARVSRAPPVPVHVHPQAEHPPRQPLPATHPAPPNPPPAAVVGDARLQRQGVARAAFGAEPTPRNADAPEGLQKRLRSPEPASGPIATGSPPAATRCRSG